MLNLRRSSVIVLMAIFILPLIIYIIIGLVFTSKVQSDPKQALFSKGKFPDPLPDGLYKGNAEGQGNWLGKEFNSTEQTGINNFKDGETVTKAYPFKTYKGKGLQDPNIDVLKIDYNIPENPLHVRLILDEVVEIEPGKLLGKFHFRLIPFVPFTVTYFELSK